MSLDQLALFYQAIVKEYKVQLVQVKAPYCLVKKIRWYDRPDEITIESHFLARHSAI